jgi:signal peptidase II
MASSLSSPPRRLHNRGFLLAALLLVVLDQITKVWVKGFTMFGVHHQGMFLGESFPVLPSVLGDVLRISYVENPGMAFGIGFGAAKIFLSLFSVVASLGLAWFIARLSVQHFWLRLGLTLVLAGATGNLIDRVFYGVLYGENPLFYGYVVDFIDVDIPDVSLMGRELTRFWVFNVADSCVTCGMVLLLLFNHHLPFIQQAQQIQQAQPAQQAEPSSADSSPSDSSPSDSSLPAVTRHD